MRCATINRRDATLYHGLASRQLTTNSVSYFLVRQKYDADDTLVSTSILEIPVSPIRGLYRRHGQVVDYQKTERHIISENAVNVMCATQSHQQKS